MSVFNESRICQRRVNHFVSGYPKKHNGDEEKYINIGYVIYPALDPYTSDISKYQTNFADSVFPVSIQKPSPKRDPIKEISKLTNTNKAVARELFEGIRDEINQICQEENVAFIDPEEKIKIILSAIQGLSRVTKRIAKDIK